MKKIRKKISDWLEKLANWIEPKPKIISWKWRKETTIFSPNYPIILRKGNDHED